MATGSRINTGYNDWFTLPGQLPNAPDGMDWSTGPRELVDTTPAPVGAFTNTQPSGVTPYASRPGAKVRTFFDDLYGRIHFTPADVDFGTFTSDVAVNVVVWNANYGRDVVLQSVDVPAGAGVFVTGQTLPKTIASLDAATFQVRARSAGEPRLDTEIKWNFDLPWTYDMAVTGIRSKIWPFLPNWGAQPYQIEYAFKTETIVSHAGKEQRIALRTSPRKTVSFNSLLAHDSFRAFKDLMWHWQNRMLILPEMTRHATSITAQPEGESTMVFSRIPAGVKAGDTVMVAHGKRQNLRPIDSIAGTTVTFRTSATEDWPVGTKLYPALSGFVETQLSAPRSTNAVAQVGLEFNVDPLSEGPINPPPAALTFRGREVFLKKPNWAQPVDSSAAHEVSILDYERGPVARFSPIKFGYETRRATYLNRDSGYAQEMLDFYLRMRGRQGEFYMPTWEYDFVPVGDASANSSSLRVAGTDFLEAYRDSTVHKAMFVQLNTGEILLRRVISLDQVVVGGETDTLISVDANWGRLINTQTVVMCGWLPVWGLVSDNLLVNWRTNEVAEITLNMRTLEDLPAEEP